MGMGKGKVGPGKGASGSGEELEEGGYGVGYGGFWWRQGLEIWAAAGALAEARLIGKGLWLHEEPRCERRSLR